MGDIVKRLRVYAAGWRGKGMDESLPVEAADRIEDLEAQLAAADECINAMNFTVAIAHKFDWGDGSTIALLDEILTAQNMAIAAYLKARGQP